MSSIAVYFCRAGADQATEVEEQLPNTKIDAPLTSWKEFVATHDWSVGFP